MATGSAHGRVNLIGEHTDYNGGLALPTLIAPRTTVSVVPRRDDTVTLATDVPWLDPVTASLAAATPRGVWGDYIIGIVDALRRRGVPCGGFDAAVVSDLPVGAGLASSAALLVATARALRAAFGLSLDDNAVADVAHEAEVSFVGARVGRMDQLVCSVGRRGEALFIDTRDLRTRPLALGALDLELAVIDSGIRHDHATGAYNERRAECEHAARLLGVAALRDVGPDADLSGLPRTLAARVRHVLSENARVLAAVAAIEARDARALGAVVSAGHASLRDDFQVSLPEIDAIVGAAQRDADVHGARLTGGGFGGSVLVLARSGRARAAAERIVGATSGRIVVPAGDAVES